MDNLGKVMEKLNKSRKPVEEKPVEEKPVEEVVKDELVAIKEAVKDETNIEEDDEDLDEELEEEETVEEKPKPVEKEPEPVEEAVKEEKPNNDELLGAEINILQNTGIYRHQLLSRLDKLNEILGGGDGKA